MKYGHVERSDKAQSDFQISANNICG